MCPYIEKRSDCLSISGRCYIIHSDRGTQYASEIYQKAIPDYHINQSMNSVGGCCHDNAQCESIWARMKTELLYDCYDTEKMGEN